MKLHRIERQSDWQDIPAEDLNFFQKIAKKTHGIVTPANVITTIGLGLVIDGCNDLDQNPNKALIKVSAGRVADYLDGIVADKTQTKSKIGEAADVMADKIAALALLKSINDNKLLSNSFLNFLVLQNSANSSLGLYSKLSHQELHSSKNGKIATALQTGIFMTSIASYTLEKSYPTHQKEVRKIQNLLTLLTIPTIVMSALATYDYLNGQS